jgi:hypothetical protein
MIIAQPVKGVKPLLENVVMIKLRYAKVLMVLVGMGSHASTQLLGTVSASLVVNI